MKSFNLSIITLCCIVFFAACTQSNEISEKSTKNDKTAISKVPTKAKEFVFEIPALQKREGELAETPEWTEIWEQGQNLYQKVRMTGDAKSALYLAAIYMQEARITGDHPYYYNAALDVLNIVIENPPKESILKYQALTSKASVLLSQHQFSEALAVGKEALKIEQKDAQVYGVLCDANVELGKYKEAVAMGDKMVSIKPDLRSYARISYLRELHGDFDGAVKAMDLAISAGIPGHENTAWARHTLANLYLDYGKVEEGKKQLEQCLKERPTYAFAMATLADLELEKGKIESSEKIIDKACALMPEFSFFVTKAKIQKAQGKTDAFEKSRNELLVMMKEDTESGHNMSLETARIYLDLFEDTKNALKFTSSEFALRPNNNEVNKLMGEIEFAAGNYAEAISYFEKASQTKWLAPDLLCMRGVSLCKEGKTVEGKKMLQLALQSKGTLDKNLVSESLVLLKSM